MIINVDQQKPAIVHEKNVQKKIQPSQTAKSSVSVTSAVPRSAVSLAVNSGLPADKLSASIISFARFFSLHLKPNTLAAIRRQAFIPMPRFVSGAAQTATPAANPGAASDTSAAARIRQALSLAAAAAESKGVELQPKGLEAYAEAVDTDLYKQNEEEQRKKRNRKQNDQNEKTLDKTTEITADQLKKMANEYAENDPLLDILNRLPGKNGNRWIVMPFCFSENGLEYRVSMRILLEDECRAVRLAIQLSISYEEGADNSGSEKENLLFVLDTIGNQLNKVTVYIQTPDSNTGTDGKPERMQLYGIGTFENKTRFISKLSEILQIPDEEFEMNTNFGYLFPEAEAREDFIKHGFGGICTRDIADVKKCGLDVGGEHVR